ncbi:uncharacterized protein [Medicago truncatula]|nr:uncharacterized protein LOC11430414 [Medicago truncatula]XP_024629491.1 uncharacterized protein LOC11430414 [Medicago truncatula]XP_024629494.1 uncharacterized protein LOC11430414 [Medicago truncatula]XP_039684581.1 uncharacterized protein LOC11430414 [Medicago truncatula]
MSKNSSSDPSPLDKSPDEGVEGRIGDSSFNHQLSYDEAAGLGSSLNMDVGSIGDGFIDELLADDELSRMIESVEVPGLGSSGDMDVDQILYMDTPSTAMPSGSSSQFGVPPHEGDRQMVVFSGPQLSNMMVSTDVYANDITVVPRSGSSYSNVENDAVLCGCYYLNEDVNRIVNHPILGTHLYHRNKAAIVQKISKIRVSCNKKKTPTPWEEIRLEKGPPPTVPNPQFLHRHPDANLPVEQSPLRVRVPQLAPSQHPHCSQARVPQHEQTQHSIAQQHAPSDLQSMFDAMETRLGKKLDDTESRLGQKVDDVVGAMELRLGKRVNDVDDKVKAVKDHLKLP